MEFANDFLLENHTRGLSVTLKSVLGYWNQLVWELLRREKPDM